MMSLIQTMVFFYSHTKGTYCCFSNFYPAKFSDNGLGADPEGPHASLSRAGLLDEPIDGKDYPDTEVYMHYAKALAHGNLEAAEAIINSKSPLEAKKLAGRGGLIDNYDEKLWSDIRYQVMVEGLKLKFSQNRAMKAELLSTGNEMLYEASPYDKIWGIGYSVSKAQNVDPSKYGTNLLGKALVEVRTWLRNRDKPKLVITKIPQP